jgi:hypothetical protein
LELALPFHGQKLGKAMAGVFKFVGFFKAASGL